MQQIREKVNKTPDKVTPAPTDGNQFKMKFHTSCHIFLSLLFLLQFSNAGEPGDIALVMQRNVERLIEKILTHVEEYYQNVKGEVKCIPDYIPDNLIEILKKSIDCVHVNEKYYVKGKITSKVHLKNFLQCFSIAKMKVEDTMRAIDPSLDHCPNNMTEKTYQINVTTTFTKTFHINIKNGLEVSHHEIDFSKDFIDSFDHNLTITDNSTGWESTEGYDVHYSSSENNYKGQDLDEPINLLTNENNQAEGNSTEEELSEEEPTPERQFRHSDRKESEEESEENDYYENDRRIESESSDEYSYEDDRNDGNGSETKEYFEKIKPQIKNTETFMAAEKHVQVDVI